MLRRNLILEIQATVTEFRTLLAAGYLVYNSKPDVVLRRWFSRNRKLGLYIYTFTVYLVFRINNCIS